MLQTEGWLIYAIISTLLYGAAAIFSKLATNHIDFKSALAYELVGGLLVGLVVFSLTGFNVVLDTRGGIYALLIGAIGTSATLFFIIAMSKGDASIVATVIALYPIVTVVLAFFVFKEHISIRQGIGLVLALCAIMLCSIENPPSQDTAILTSTSPIAPVESPQPEIELGN